MTPTVRIFSPREDITFDGERFVLSTLTVGAAALAAGRTAGRTVRFAGYLLPFGGETLDALCRRLCRLVTAEGGFTLSVDGRLLPLVPEESPAFAADAPFATGEAAHFTVTARAKFPYEATFADGEETVVLSQSFGGELVFPLAITENTLFGLRKSKASVSLYNPGDMPVGFRGTVTVTGADIEGFTLTRGAEHLTVNAPLAPGDTVDFSTCPGEKYVRNGAGESLLYALSEDSRFFAVPAGESRLDFAARGDGALALRLVYTPRYY